MHGFILTITGIPISADNKKWLVSRKWLTDKKNKKEKLIKFDNDKVTASTCPSIQKHLGLGEDKDPQTRLERNLDRDWAEKIHYGPTEQLSSGDRVYFRDHEAKAHKRWKAGIILQRKKTMSTGKASTRAMVLIYIILSLENMSPAPDWTLENTNILKLRPSWSELQSTT